MADLLMRSIAVRIADFIVTRTEHARLKAAREADRAQCAGDGARRSTRHDLQNHPMLRYPGLAAVGFPLRQCLKQKVHHSSRIGTCGNRACQSQSKLNGLGCAASTDELAPWRRPMRWAKCNRLNN